MLKVEEICKIICDHFDDLPPRDQALLRAFAGEILLTIGPTGAIQEVAA